MREISGQARNEEIPGQARDEEKSPERMDVIFVGRYSALCCAWGCARSLRGGIRTS